MQGTGADIVSAARVLLNSKLQKHKVTGHICLTVHDSIVVDCPKKEVDLVAKLMYDSFNELPQYVKKIFDIDLPFPFPGEVKYGPNLADMIEIKESEL